jgi:hypothetical protein
MVNEMTIAVRVLALLLLIPVACAMAPSMAPRAYTNVPVGLNFLVVAYGYSQGEVGVDSSVPLQDGAERRQPGSRTNVQYRQRRRLTTVLQHRDAVIRWSDVLTP